jgi:DNA-directed RNA polymerase subunit H (RpoH/RPB5)
MDQSYLYKFGLAINNLGRLLKDRGYSVSEVSFFGDDPLRTVGQIHKIAKSRNCSLGEAVRRTFNCEKPSLSIWCLDRNYDASRQRDRMISTEQVKYLCDVMDPDDINLVLSPNKLSPQARKEMPKHAELFLFEDLFIDLPRHSLCVHHEVITIEKLRTVLGETMQPTDLPLLLKSDPMVRWYGWPKGTIIFLKNPVMNSFRIVF